MTRVRPGRTPINNPITMPMISIAKLRGVRHWRKPNHSWATMSVMTSAPRNEEEQVGDPVKGRNAARQRYVRNAQKQDSDEQGDGRTGCPRGAMISVAPEIHEGGGEEKRGKEESQEGDQDGIEAN